MESTTRSRHHPSPAYAVDQQRSLTVKMIALIANGRKIVARHYFSKYASSGGQFSLNTAVLMSVEQALTR